MQRAASSLRSSMMAALTVAGRIPISIQAGFGTPLASVGTICSSIASGCGDHGDLIRRSMEIGVDATGFLPTTAAVVALLWTLGTGEWQSGNKPTSLISVILSGTVLVCIRALLLAG